MTTRRGTSWLLHLVAGATLLGAAAAAGQAAAATPRCDHHIGVPAETLRVAVTPATDVLRAGRATGVRVVVTRSAVHELGEPAAVAGSTVSVRLETRSGATYRWAFTDEHGVAAVDLTPLAGTPRGAATLVAEAWTEPDTLLQCGPTVDEHGYVESTVEVR